MADTTPQAGYADVNGLRMYYEVHGEGGVPLVLLHGGISTMAIDFGAILPGLAETRKVIGIEQQAHGHTEDLDRPEHAVEVFRLFGGGVPGDMAGLPASQLAILPGTAHITLVQRPEWLLPMVPQYLDAPLPEAG